MTNLPCLSIRQPWLYCITDGDKRTENRTWKPPSGLIGKRIGLHASITLSRQDVPAAARLMRVNLHHADLFTRGAIVATARLAGYVRVCATAQECCQRLVRWGGFGAVWPVPSVLRMAC
ncbi:MAG: hypothetical protein KDD89_03570 [Anaerolineales bacterium]|nr:hypothetical protein [Anaerolineales bacterium]